MITRAARLMGPAGGLRPVAGYDGIQSSRDARARQSANVRPTSNPRPVAAAHPLAAAQHDQREERAVDLTGVVPAVRARPMASGIPRIRQ